MKWIIWTIGWFLVCSYYEYINFIKNGMTIKKSKKDYIESLLFVILWIIGMIKFW